MLVIQENVSLKLYNSWKVGGAAEYFCAPSTVEEVREAFRIASRENWSIQILAGGTNSLVSDDGIAGLVISTNSLKKMDVYIEDERLAIEAEAGVAKSKLLKHFLKERLAPALFLAGLPGGVGGGVVMNAGIGEDYTPKEFCELVEWIEVVSPNGELKRISAENLQWHYRHCGGWQPGLIYQAKLSWPLEPIEGLREKVKEANQRRLNKQPLELPSCGSVFRNPPGDKAGALIESCGLKGYRLGDAQVSEKHANFIVNLGDAKASDLKGVIEHVQSTVKAQTGQELTTEVVFMGSF